MTTSGADFIARSRAAINNDQLQAALAKARPGFVRKRQLAVEKAGNFDSLRDKAQEVRQRSLKNLDTYLAIFARRVTAAGGHVHWADTPTDLRRIVLNIALEAKAHTATKGKSMVAEEAELNTALEMAGIAPLETDLGEYILQLAKEPPSHIVAPALHKTRQQVSELFLNHHDLGARSLEAISDIVDEARQVIRNHFLNSDLGITGANVLIADTGTAVLCTNEGNGDLTASLPDTHIVVTSIDKVVATWSDASAILRVLARSATGQSATTYTSFYGARQKGDLDGPGNFHVVLLDNRRSDLLGSEFQDILQCIKCGACMNHCPVYQTVGGHSYDAVYPGPMGAVLTPLLGEKKIPGGHTNFDLANASTFCGRCEEVCPVKIPLPDLLRKLRQRQADEQGFGLSGWLMQGFMALARAPRLYRLLTSSVAQLLHKFARQGNLANLPGLGRWQRHKKLAAPQGKSFQQQWHQAKSQIKRKQHGD